MMLKNRTTPPTDMTSAMIIDGRAKAIGWNRRSALMLCQYSIVPITIARVPSAVRKSPTLRGVSACGSDRPACWNPSSTL